MKLFHLKITFYVIYFKIFKSFIKKDSLYDFLYDNSKAIIKNEYNFCEFITSRIDGKYYARQLL